MMSMKNKTLWFFYSVLLLFFLFFKPKLCIASDTISPGQSLSGNQTITSKNGVFELGFFKPGNSQKYYIGIWYKRIPIQTLVWVANRNQPIFSNPSSAELKLTQNGTLVLLNQSKAVVWSTDSSSRNPNSTIAILLDSGNFAIKHISDSSEETKWQSFDHPTDTWLPGGKFGNKKFTNEKLNLVPWRSSENPAPGIFSADVQNGSAHSHLLLWNESEVYWNSGDWNGKVFSLVPELQLNYLVKNFTLITNENESYFTYESAMPVLTRFVLEFSGQLKQFAWMSDKWALFWSRPEQKCDVYAFCGAFSSCNQKNSAPCDCIQGFEPKVKRDWVLGANSEGCLRRTSLQCDGNDTFFRIPNSEFPVNQVTFSAASTEECRLACLSNCSCTAYAYDNGCLVWRGDLLNLKELSPDDKLGKNFYVRIAASDLVGVKSKAKGKTIWIVIGSIASFVTLLGIVLVTILKRRKLRGKFQEVGDSLLLFKFQDLRIATKNFSEKLGEGGFGSVYKGTLPNSTAIAVKELKSLPIQGEKQFRAEVSTIGTIQHINLVRLRGFCAGVSKRFLVYEYMPNGSLESHLFSKSSVVLLDWKTRFNIAVGTARGLTYLHEKCRDCIIHCDIKPDNILLDADYNPKIADFGLAKLLGRELSRVLTTFRGTRGYLAPEWISGEPVTAKADVFSYGMVLMEIISGRRNREFSDDGLEKYFPRQVANAICKGEDIDVLTLLDDRLEGNADEKELYRACKIACWCIQDNEKDRPSMGKVVQFLEGIIEVGIPSIPRFFQCLAESPAGTIIYQEVSSS